MAQAFTLPLCKITHQAIIGRQLSHWTVIQPIHFILNIWRVRFEDVFVNKMCPLHRQYLQQFFDRIMFNS